MQGGAAETSSDHQSTVGSSSSVEFPPDHFPVLNADVLGVILQFSVDRTLRDCYSIGLTCHAWYNALDDCEPLWMMIMRLLFPNSPLTPWPRAVFLARGRGRGRLSGLKAKELHPIEHCPGLESGCEMICPAFAEGLCPSARYSSALWCTTCQADVALLDLDRSRRRLHLKEQSPYSTVDPSKVVIPSRLGHPLNRLNIVLLDLKRGELAKSLIQKMASLASQKGEPIATTRPFQSKYYTLQSRSVELDPLRVNYLTRYQLIELASFYSGYLCIEQGGGVDGGTGEPTWQYVSRCWMPSVLYLCDPALKQIPEVDLKKVVNAGVVVDASGWDAADLLQPRFMPDLRDRRVDE